MALFNVSPRFSPIKSSSPGPGSHFASPTNTGEEVLDFQNTSILNGSIRRSPNANAQKVASCSHCYSSFISNLRKDVHSLKVRNKSLLSAAVRAASLNQTAYREYREKSGPARGLLVREEVRPQYWRRKSDNTKVFLEQKKDLIESFVSSGCEKLGQTVPRGRMCKPVQK